jgi:hypothetical protein
VSTTAPAPASTFARRHAWAAVLVVGAALFLIEERTLVATGIPNLDPSAIAHRAGRGAAPRTVAYGGPV